MKITDFVIDFLTGIWVSKEPTKSHSILMIHSYLYVIFWCWSFLTLVLLWGFVGWCIGMVYTVLLFVVFKTTTHQWIWLISPYLLIIAAHWIWLKLFYVEMKLSKHSLKELEIDQLLERENTVVFLKREFATYVKLKV